MSLFVSSDLHLACSSLILSLNFGVSSTFACPTHNGVSLATFFNPWFYCLQGTCARARIGCIIASEAAEGNFSINIKNSSGSTKELAWILPLT
jgi:hypothetical protein